MNDDGIQELGKTLPSAQPKGRSLSTLAILAVVICAGSSLGCNNRSDMRSECVMGCRDACGPRFEASCISDYQSGYMLGFQDGRAGRLTDGFNTDGFVAGYWDGIADGQASRR